MTYLLVLEIAFVLGSAISAHSFQCTSNADCRHGGICIVNRVDYMTHVDSNRGEGHGGYCNCPSGYRNTPDCSGDYYCPVSCQNHGRCYRQRPSTKGPWEYRCDCPVDSVGEHCEYRRTACPDQTTYCVEELEVCRKINSTLFLCVLNETNQGIQTSAGSLGSDPRTSAGGVVGVLAMLLCGMILLGMHVIRAVNRRRYESLNTQSSGTIQFQNSYRDGASPAVQEDIHQSDEVEEGVVDFTASERCII
jgi:hypothetical protein